MSVTARVSGAGAGEPAWHEPVRGHFQAAWDALDRAQIALYQEFKGTGDERVRRFKERFGAAAGKLINMGIAELFPGPDDELDRPSADGDAI